VAGVRDPRPAALAPAAIVAMVAAGPVYRGLAVLAQFNWVAVYSVTFACTDSLGMGALLAYCSRRGPASRPTVRRLARIGLWLGGPLALACLVAARLDRLWGARTILEDTLAALVFVWLVARAAHGFGGLAGAVLSSRPLVYLGTISYGLYVVHLLVPGALAATVARAGLALPGHPALRFACLVATTIGVATLSWFCIERPLNALKRHFPYDVGGPRAGVRVPSMRRVEEAIPSLAGVEGPVRDRGDAAG
jgi:peptidoglycan/LPS O-acetylase OafA/YrhL